MNTNDRSSPRYTFVLRDGAGPPPVSIRGILRDTGSDIWFAPSQPESSDGFRLIVECPPGGGHGDRWSVKDLDHIVARALPEAQQGRVLFVGHAADGRAATAAAACALASGSWEHVEAALGMVRVPRFKIPKSLRRSLAEWWTIRKLVLPPSVERWEALEGVATFGASWELLAMAPFGASSLMRYASIMNEGVGEATPFLVPAAAPGRETVVEQMAAEFETKAGELLDMLEARDPLRGREVRKKWAAWWKAVSPAGGAA